MRLALAGLMLVAALSVGAAPAAAAEAPYRVLYEEAARHRIAGLQHLRAADAPADPPASIALDLVVSAAGAVVRADPARGQRPAAPGTREAQWLEAARAAALRWRFRPFLRDGRPAAAVTAVHFAVVPPERPAAPAAALPEAPAEDVSITLRREGCYGPCMAYSVTVRGDGRVRFEGLNDTLVAGVHDYAVPRESAERLIARFRAAGFGSFDAAYRASVPYGSTQALTFAAGRYSHTVLDYAGERVGMPDAVRELEDAVDEAADTVRWTHGSEATLPSLAAEGFDFRSEEAARLLVASIGRAPDAVPLRLIEAGAPLEAPESCSHCWGGTVREAALEAAVEHGRIALFDRLDRPGALEAMAEERRNLLLLAAAKVRSPSLVERLLRAGASMAANTFGGGNALFHAVGDAWELASDADGEAVVRLLLARGADIRTTDGIGWTALQHAYDESAALVPILLAAGADVNGAGPDGHPLLYLTEDEEIALAALAAGADRSLRDPYGRTLAERARHYGWTRVEALLAGG